MNAWFAEIAIGIGASFAATLLVKATLTLAVALAVTGLARRSRAAARHVLLVAAFAVLLVLPAASFMMPSRGLRLPATRFCRKVLFGALLCVLKLHAACRKRRCGVSAKTAALSFATRSTMNHCRWPFRFSLRMAASWRPSSGLVPPTPTKQPSADNISQCSNARASESRRCSWRSPT